MSPVIKRGGDKFTIPGKYLLFILTIVAVALMVITLTTSLFSGIANTIAGFVVVPFQRGITTAGTWLISEADKLETIERLQSENDELQARVDQLTE
jgi:rod shape-determining protein MreC